jgi:hypothetical protein
MFARLQSKIGAAWCSLTHESLMWPVHGYYRCRTCGRRYPAFADALVAGRPRETKSLASLRLTPRSSGALIRISIAAVALAAGAAHTALSAGLQPATLNAWNAYVDIAGSHMQERAATGLPFLWMDESPDRAARVRRGEVVFAPVVGRGTEGVPHGLIHDWIGAIFIPGASIDNLWAVVHDYDNYRQMYQPVVSSSRTLACADNNQEFQMVWQRKVLFVSAVIDGYYQAHDVMLDAHRGYSVAEAVEVREIEAYGQAGERRLPPDTGNGFIWRIRSIARYEERDGGVYLELEALALTRDIPASLAWMVKPVVNRLSVNSLTTTLRQTRDAVISSLSRSETLASCPIPSRVELAKAGAE